MKLNKDLIKDKAKFYFDEYSKCKNSFDYFCRNYIRLEIPGGDIPFKPYKKQSEYIELLQKDRYLVILKTRQVGLSLTTQIFFCWVMTMFSGISIGIISKDGGEASNFATRIASFIDDLPTWMKSDFIKRNVREFKLSNGSACYSASINPAMPSKIFRGRSLHFCCIDEAAFISNLDIAMTAIIPSLSISQKQAKEQGAPYGTVIISTPQGTSGAGAWFHQKYMKALNGDDIFKPFTVYWKDIEEIASDPLWYEQQRRLFDNEKQLMQELEMQFLNSEGSFFDENICSQLQTNTRDLEPLTKHKIFNGEIHTFALPTPNTNYIIGVDTAPEIGNDKSAIVVLDYISLNQVFEYRGKCQVQDFIKIVKSTMISYPGVTVIENNSYGNQVVEAINNSEFSHALYREKRSANLIVPGLSVNAKTRPLIIDALYSYVTEFPNIIKSRRLALELIGLEYKQPGGKVEAGSGMTDDLSLCLGFICYVRKYDPPMFINHNSEEYSNMIDIFDLNDDTKYFNAYTDTDHKNAKILKQVKDNYKDYEGYTDLFSITSG